MTLRGAAYAMGLLVRMREAIVPDTPAGLAGTTAQADMSAGDSPVNAVRMMPTLFGFGAIGHDGGVEETVPYLPGRGDQD